MTFLPSTLTRLKEGVYQALGPYSRLSEAEVAFLVADAKANTLQRSRINFHKSLDALTHEMIIAMYKSTTIQVHKHLSKSESFHLLIGSLMVILFDEDGCVIDEILLTSSSLKCYYRLDDSIDHLVIPLSEYVVMHETTSGPFRDGDSSTPEWAGTDDGQSKIQYLRNHHVRKFETVRRRSI